MTGASSRVATFAIASAFAEAMAVKSAAEERVENAEPRQIRRGSKVRLKRTLIWKQPEQPGEQLFHRRADWLRPPVVVP